MKTFILKLKYQNNHLLPASHLLLLKQKLVLKQLTVKIQLEKFFGMLKLQEHFLIMAHQPLVHLSLLLLLQIITTGRFQIVPALKK